MLQFKKFSIVIMVTKAIKGFYSFRKMSYLYFTAQISVPLPFILIIKQSM